MTSTWYVPSTASAAYTGKVPQPASNMNGATATGTDAGDVVVALVRQTVPTPPRCAPPSYAAGMNERATHNPAGTEEGHPAASAEVRRRAERPSIAGGGSHETAELSQVFQAIAARLDAVLDAEVAERDASETRHRLSQAASPESERRDTHSTPDVLRQELATTVLRISADGRLDVDDRVREGEGIDDAPTPAPAVTVRVPGTESCAAPDAVPAAPAPVGAGRSNVEDRLRAVRERLATRRASTVVARADAPTAPMPSVRPGPWRRTEVRIVLRKLLIGLAIVGLSVAVSLLVA